MDELTPELCAAWGRIADALGRTLYITRSSSGTLGAFTNPAQSTGEIVAMISCVFSAKGDERGITSHGLGAIVGGAPST
jgi:hypothetical protein